jgi:hypothetical protein
MKKQVIGMGIFVSAVLLFAGGDFVPATPAVAKIGAPCKAHEVYVDRDTDLMWQDAPYTAAEDGAYARNRSVAKAGSLNHAINYCRRLNYAGFTDWRLPTADELMQVHHHPGEDFINMRDKDFWSSTPTTDGKYYVVYPVDAYEYKRNKNQSNYVRCVRCAAK